MCDEICLVTPQQSVPGYYHASSTFCHNLIIKILVVVGFEILKLILTSTVTVSFIYEETVYCTLILSTLMKHGQTRVTAASPKNGGLEIRAMGNSCQHLTTVYMASRRDNYCQQADVTYLRKVMCLS